MNNKKKLIEVALPLEAINRESAREKSIRHGHPSTLHLWWARRPLAACRAVLFASLVDDPSAHPDRFPTEEAQEVERQRLFGIIEELVKWENSNNERVLEMAREEIRASTGGNPPPVYDPFCGGGSIPLEAQRLGLEAHASDLNPVAVLITKALIEIPPKFTGQAPVHPTAKKGKLVDGGWKGAKGLAEDVRCYGQWMRDEAEKRIGHLYPKVKLPPEQGSGEATVIAWLWARTVTCPNPACGAEMPLVRSFALSTKKGKEAHVEPIIKGNAYRFEVRYGGEVPDPPKVGRGAKFRCICCNQVAPDDHIKKEGMEGRMGARLMAIVAEGEKGRLYLPPNDEHEDVARKEKPKWSPEGEMPKNPRWFSPPEFGMKSFADLFTQRQLVALTTFSELVGEAREQVFADARAAGLPDDGIGIEAGGTGAPAYADAVAIYLSCGVSRIANRLSTICIWNRAGEKIEQVFARQAIPMTWDYAETNVLSDSTGGWSSSLGWIPKVLKFLPYQVFGEAFQSDATKQPSGNRMMISTDPPYYDNIGYADLSDYFYIWLRKSLKPIIPTLLATLAVPKVNELVATPYRHGSKDKAETFFLNNMTCAIKHLTKLSHALFPVTIYYAFKQAENKDQTGTSNTGWETFLDAVICAGFGIVGTWPIRTERDFGVKTGTNVLASSIVLVCRPRSSDAPLATRSEFLRELKAELPKALKQLQKGNIAPVDLAQSAIGPGMAVFSKYSKVLDTNGQPVHVREALALINQVLDDVLAEQEGDFDADTRWALSWFEQNGFDSGEFGIAETLSKAKNTSVQGMVEAGILASKGGKVRLLRPEELAADWDPATDKRLTVWEMTHHLIRLLTTEGETSAAELASRLGSTAETARELAYRLYNICERKKRAREALGYNALVQSWPEIIRLARARGTRETGQSEMFEQE